MGTLDIKMVSLRQCLIENADMAVLIVIASSAPACCVGVALCIDAEGATQVRPADF